MIWIGTHALGFESGQRSIRKVSDEAGRLLDADYVALLVVAGGFSRSLLAEAQQVRRSDEEGKGETDPR